MRTTRLLHLMALGTTLGLAAGCGDGDGSGSSDMPAIGALVDRVGRPFTAEALAAPFGTADAHADAAVRWKSGTESERLTLVLKGLADLDGLDGECGNQLFAGDAGPDRYRALGTILLDDRLLVDSRTITCGRFFALETSAAGDCGGLSPELDEPDTLLSYLVSGAATGVTDGVDRDPDGTLSNAMFPFLRPPL